jgi:hypothetical protein
MSSGERTGLGKVVRWIVIVVAVGVGAPFALPAFSSCAAHTSGYGDFVMDRLNDCQPAREMLGDDIGTALVGLAWGSSETKGGQFGNAQWRVPVSGSRSSGVYQYALELHGGQWTMMRGQLEVGGMVLDVAACPRSAQAARDLPLGTTGGPGALAAAHAAVACFQRQDMSCAAANSRTGCDLGDIAACGNLSSVLHEHLGDLPGAVAAGRKACQGGSASGCANLGEALRKTGDLAGADEALSQSCALGLDIGCAQLAHLRLLRGDPATAIQSAHKALELNPHRSAAFRQMGHAWLFSGNADQALVHYGRALQTAAVADQGSGIVDDSNDTPLGLIQKELEALARVYPARSADVQRARAGLSSLMPAGVAR